MLLDKAALYIYFGIFISLVAAGLGFPIPEEIPIVTAGAWVGHASGDSADRVVPSVAAALAASPPAGFPAGIPWSGLYSVGNVELPPPLRWWVMLPLCILGVVISDGLLYGIGRFWGPRLFETRWIKGLVPPEKRARIEENFHRYGVMVLLFARFLPTIRSPVFITAGVMRLSLARFLLADGLYAIPGVSLLFFLAFWFGDQFRDLIYSAAGRVQAARPILILLGLAAIALYLVFHFLRHPVATGDPREEVPVIGEQLATKMAPSLDQVSEPSADKNISSAESNANHAPDAARHRSVDSEQTKSI
jgi:membrane protein DedA with SNARE-associated domain